MKIDFSDVSFLIPIRVDSIQRIENIIMVVDYITSHFITNIFVIEADAYNNGILESCLPKDVHYLFVEDYDNIFHRTKYINQLLKASQSKIVAVWDTDIIIPIPQLKESLDMLRRGIQVVYPYSGTFYDTSRLIRESFWKKRDVKFLEDNISKMKTIYGKDMKGGAFMINRKIYIKMGGENENFYGWGPEDWDRYERWKKIGLTIHRCKGVLFHLTHTRGINSSFRNSSQMKLSNRLYRKTLSSSREELLYEINNFEEFE